MNFNKIIIFLFNLLIFALIGIFIFNYFVKSKYLYNNLNFYTGLPNTNEIFQNEDQKITGEKILIFNDKNGFRNNIDIENTKILFLGDSFIRGKNTQDEKLLSNIFGVNIYNAGMDGFSTFNSVSVAKYLFEKNNFDKIFLFFTLNNDFRDNMYQKRYENNLKDKIIIYLKNNSFFWKLNNLKNMVYYEKKINSDKSSIKEINKPYYSINFLKLLIDDKNFQKKIKLHTLDALTRMKKISKDYDSELVVIAIPTLAEISKNYMLIKDIKRDLSLEGININELNLNIDYDNPKKILMEICQEIELNCHYLNNLNENSYYKIDDHWNFQGQAKAKEYIINNNLIN